MLAALRPSRSSALIQQVNLGQATVREIEIAGGVASCAAFAWRIHVTDTAGLGMFALGPGGVKRDICYP
jgi:environmental stress-induced protein Ves